MEYIYLILSLAMIIVGAMMLTDGSVALAARFRVSEFVVGLTIVAVGTSLPELVTSVVAAKKGENAGKSLKAFRFPPQLPRNRDLLLLLLPPQCWHLKPEG